VGREENANQTGSGSRPPDPWPAASLAKPALIALAVLWTLLNAIKPLMIDDPFFYAYAVQIVRSPLEVTLLRITEDHIAAAARHNKRTDR
jgi:hypothetical protein